MSHGMVSCKVEAREPGNSDVGVTRTDMSNSAEMRVKATGSGITGARDGVIVETELPEHLEELYCKSEETLRSDGERQEVRDLLRRYQDVLMGLEGKLERLAAGTHVINTGDSAPVKQRPYRMSSEGHRVVEQECKEMQRKEVIMESKSPWSSPVVLVTKNNGEVRFCVDYRKLLPNIQDTLGNLGGCKYFCTMDLPVGSGRYP